VASNPDFYIPYSSVLDSGSKSQPLREIWLISGGFLVRIFGGTLGAGLRISPVTSLISSGGVRYVYTRSTSLLSRWREAQCCGEEGANEHYKTSYGWLALLAAFLLQYAVFAAFFISARGEITG
jgi:hypothetical protein